jgi:hypothetical protein
MGAGASLPEAFYCRPGPHARSFPGAFRQTECWALPSGRSANGEAPDHNGILVDSPHAGLGWCSNRSWCFCLQRGANSHRCAEERKYCVPALPCSCWVCRLLVALHGLFRSGVDFGAKRENNRELKHALKRKREGLGPPFVLRFKLLTSWRPSLPAC